MEITGHIRCLRIDYCRAYRCWKCNNLRSCLPICDSLTKRLNKLIATNCDKINCQRELNQLKHLIWFLKIKCLADDYYVSESLLLNEDDVGVDDQVQVFSGANHSSKVQTTTTNRTNSIGTNDGAIGKRINTGSAIIESRQRTGIITGRMPSVSSRQSGRATTSYRPLTTSLVATQTAFSRSARPLLKYSTCKFLSKPLFEYLYNIQAATNTCPDYRQCLEYLNLVQNSIRKRDNHRRDQQNREKSKASNDSSSIISILDTTIDERKSLGVFWLIAFGTCYFNLRMNKQAEEYFKLAVAINPKFIEAYAWLVKIYLRSNQSTEVLKTCEDGLKESKNVILFNWMARVQSLVCNSYSANFYLKESLNYYPTNIEALANVGHFAFYSEKLEQSLRCFERIQQLSVNQSGNLDETSTVMESSAELLNNLALCNFYCGFYHKVMPFFLKAFMSSPNKEVTSNIWFNISFIPMSCGLKNLAIGCLKLALKNNSQNEDAMNNIGVLKYGSLIDDQLHFKNRQEVWNTMQQKTILASELELENADDQSQYQATLEEAETYFNSPIQTSDEAGDSQSTTISQPEMLYNMALIKKSRGQLLASVRYSNLYLEHDPNNYHITNMMREIRDLISHDS